VRAVNYRRAGFIGSHLSEALLEQGHEVLILDNLSTGSIDTSRTSKGARVSNTSSTRSPTEPRCGGLIRSPATSSFISRARRGVKLIVRGSRCYTIEDNVHAPRSCSSTANKKKKLVVIASTSEGLREERRTCRFVKIPILVMGRRPKHRWAYACSKAVRRVPRPRLLERSGKLPVIIVRFFNTVGPRQSGQYGMVIPNFVRQALAGEPITVFGDGTSSAHSPHVSDVVGALLKLVVEPKPSVRSSTSQRPGNYHLQACRAGCGS